VEDYVVLRAASLFAGIGGLDLALKLAIPDTKTVLYIERDSYSAAALVARMEDKTLDQAPIWDDATTFDGRPWRGAVDIFTAGFPCQDISVAGRGEGIKGKQSGLWSEIVRLADEIRPRYLFLENVSVITSRGLSTVLADLAEGGFDAEWLCLRASQLQAPHRRERWFAVAHARGSELWDKPRRGCRSSWSDKAKSFRIMEDDWVPEPEAPDLRGFVDRLSGVVDASRADQLRCAGNGVVPLQAAAAFTILARRAGLGNLTDRLTNPAAARQ